MLCTFSYLNFLQLQQVLHITALLFLVWSRLMSRRSRSCGLNSHACHQNSEKALMFPQQHWHPLNLGSGFFPSGHQCWKTLPTYMHKTQRSVIVTLHVIITCSVAAGVSCSTFLCCYVLLHSVEDRKWCFNANRYGCRAFAALFK